MNIKELIMKIEKDYPIISAYDFDNTGANIVDFNDEIKNILICLDINMSVIEYAMKNNVNVIISHHPLTFNPYKNINNDIVSKRIKSLIKNGINAYSIHTNFDVNIKNGMGRLVVDKLFKKTDIKNVSFLEEKSIYKKKYALGNIITLKNEISAKDMYNKVLSSLNLNKDKTSVYLEDNIVKKVVIVPGSGSGEVNEVINIGADCFITSDLKHNQILDLIDSKISYINTTHYGAEKIFIDYMLKYLKTKIKVKIYSYYDDRF